ncbi:MAG: UDP-N-acetyl-D-glucosamine dehydrogenase, partial [Clostridiales bacterium]|nr:UDP-N-acetyl-D-glucosamine dehydrogenase [Clostridiales bacterium]
EYYDPWVKEYQKNGRKRVSLPELTAEALRSSDLVIVATAHTNVDYDFVQKNAAVIFDTKNAMKNILNRDNIELL